MIPDQQSSVILTYHNRDGIMALHQQSESRLNSWNVSKLDPCKMTAKSLREKLQPGLQRKELLYLALDISNLRQMRINCEQPKDKND